MSTDQPLGSNNPPPDESSRANTAAESGSTQGQPNRRGGRGRNRRGSGPDAIAGRGDGNADRTVNGPNNGSNRRRGGRGGPRPNQQQTSGNEARQTSPDTQQALTFISESLPNSSAAAGESNNGRQRGNNPRQRQRKGKNASNNASGGETNTQDVQQQSNDASNNNSIQTPTTTTGTSKKKKRRNRNRPRRKKPESRPWLWAIPPGSEDPITLDPIEDLPYPPFALVKSEPYTAIYPGMWPPPPLEESDEKAETNQIDPEKDREATILKEQWGEGVVKSEETAAAEAKNKPTPAPSTDQSSLQGRQFYLFDGFVLAGYLTRTLQFINPYDRRDLTRPELAALDAYMAVNELGNAGVVQAYDEKGVTLSTAGVAGQTADGRAEILRQEARAIRNAFFRSDGGNTAVSNQQSGSNPQQRSRRQQQNRGPSRGQVEGITNELQQMYRDQNNEQLNSGDLRANVQNANDTGIYADDDGGFLMIDDDINPGLRSGVPTSDTGSLPLPREIVEQHSQQSQAREGNFPSLPTVATATSNGAAAPSSIAQKVPTAPSKSLKSITKVVKKTDPAEIARQKKAREEAQRKAELSRLNFFDPTSTQAVNTNNGLLTVPIVSEKMPPTEAVLERNRNFANALGVVPAQMRNAPVLTGWARPTTVDIHLDQFGNEINATQYPDSLLSQARERMTELVKLEKIWKKFLADDKEASCSLKPMDRATRVFVHEYSDFWRLKTESYDPEGRRYIHCSKLLDTSAPHPLLSDAAKKWRGPVPGVPSIPYRAPVSLPGTSTAATGAATLTNTVDGWHTEQRVPLKLAPRTVAEGAPQPPSTGGMTRSTSTPLLSHSGEISAPARFADLHEERPKLQLAPRTIPPSEESQKQAIQSERALKKEEARIHRHEYREKKQKANEKKKKAILESAFASDDDEVDWSSDSDWFEGDAAFDGSDDEGMR